MEGRGTWHSDRCSGIVLLIGESAFGSGSGSGWGRAGGREDCDEDQERRIELATRTRWKMEDFLTGGEGSSVHKCWISLKVEKVKGEEQKG